MNYQIPTNSEVTHADAGIFEILKIVPPVFSVSSILKELEMKNSKKENLLTISASSLYQDEARA